MATKLHALRKVHKSLGEIYALLRAPKAAHGTESSVFRDSNQVAFLSNLASLQAGRSDIVHVMESARRGRKIGFLTLDALNQICVRETKVRKRLDSWAQRFPEGERPRPEVSELTDFLSKLDRDLAPLRRELKRISIQIPPGAMMRKGDASQSLPTIGGSLQMPPPPPTPTAHPAAIAPAPDGERSDEVPNPAWAGDPIGWALGQMSRTNRGTRVSARVVPAPPISPPSEPFEVAPMLDVPPPGPVERVVAREISTWPFNPPITWRTRE